MDTTPTMALEEIKEANSNSKVIIKISKSSEKVRKPRKMLKVETLVCDEQIIIAKKKKNIYHQPQSLEPDDRSDVE